MENMRTINREWVKYIDISLLEIYPIQFVNCDRLQKNDAIYILDEVGSGKTISSGLMALDYLYNNPEQRVLIITTNALAKKSNDEECGQFLRDWYTKLPFKQLGLTERIDIVNNHYSNLKNKSKYGLIIVDEAHLFLSTDSLRCQCLNGLQADKVVFLTATPIKTTEDDLYVYVELAKNITKKNVDDSWIKKINTKNADKNTIICSRFDPKEPVTRYFKDTIRSINVKGYKKIKGKRAIPQLWMYDETIASKKEVLLNTIREGYKENNNNRYVIFTRFVKKEAKDIAAYLECNGFIKFTKTQSSNVMSYKVITGDNAYELSDYSGTENLPTVLILTYQIAEQGVNLPGFNHVVNYHISAFPSALEQRFGRIDRMSKDGGVSDKIYMCFLISKGRWDTNTWNFHCATNTYLRNLISYLPSKNTMLSEEVIEKHIEAIDYAEKYVEQIEGLINDEEQLKSVIDYLKNDLKQIPCECDEILREFIDENAIEFDSTIAENVATENFRKDIMDALKEYQVLFKLNKDIPKDKCLKIIKACGDKIYYLNNENNIETLDAVEESAEYIAKQQEFIEYTSNFRNHVKLPIIVNKHLNTINKYFEKAFIDNVFLKLFPYNGYKSLFEEIFAEIELGKEDKSIILDNSDVVVSVLPLFKLFDEYKTILQKLVFTIKGKVMNTYRFDPFLQAFHSLFDKVRRDSNHYGLSDEFFNLYFLNDNYMATDICSIKVDSDTRIAQASNWYKLAYHYSRKEAWSFKRKDVDPDLFAKKDVLLKWIASNYDLYMESVGDEEKQGEFIEQYKDVMTQLHKLLRKIEKEKDNYVSLFHHFIFNNSDKYRVYSTHIKVDKHWKVCRGDLWTQGIFYEYGHVTYEGCTLNKIAHLPEEFHQYSIY